MKHLRFIALLIGILLLGSAAIFGRPQAEAQSIPATPASSPELQFIASDEFTYQGYLKDNGKPANGLFDFEFRLYDAAVEGSEVTTSAFKRNDILVTNGTFSTTLQFNTSLFNGTVRYLGIAVRPGASTGGYTGLSPRPAITGVPYAFNAGNLVMPYNAFASTPNYMMALRNSGTGGGMRISLDEASSNDGLLVRTSGTSNGGEFEIFNTNNTSAALWARTNGSGAAIQAEMNTEGGTGDALFARSTSNNSSSYAGEFLGKVRISCNPCTNQNGGAEAALYVDGLLASSSKAFKIDHPLDPANKYLYHTSVESPDMKNIYDGVVTLGPDGSATVTLPDWFEALNMNFRYQLTPLGAFAPLYIAQEITNNQFVIAGGTPGMRVSWQVTGIRHDTYANEHRTPVEQEKPADERGHYVNSIAPSTVTP